MATAQTAQSTGNGRARYDIPDRGVDTQEARPGVPMELPPDPYRGGSSVIPQQVANVPILKRMELDGLTPVFGTAQPPKGLSGAIRALAYKIPEHRPVRWMTLLAADRVDVTESKLGGAAKWAPLVVPLALLGVVAARRRPTGWRRVFG